MHHLLHAVDGVIPVARVLQLDVRQRLGVNRQVALDTPGQMRTDPLAAGRHQGCGLGQLQRRGLHVALADAEDHRFAGIPGLPVARTLPLPRRHQAGRLFEHIQRDALADAEARHVVMHAIDAQLVRHIVEIGVVGTRDRQLEVHRAVAAAVPVAVLVLDVGQLEVARVEHLGLRRDHPRIETGHGHHRLDGRTRRIEPAQHPVEQRPIDRIAQFAVVLETDAGHEQVGVEARLADHRQHLAGGRLQRDDGTTAPRQGLLGGLLQIQVEGQGQVLARYRIGPLEHPQHAAAGIGFDLFVAHLAMQLVFVELFHAGLADVVRAAVVDRIDLLQLRLVDTPHITHRMREMRALRVMADQLRRHFDPRQAELIDGDTGDLFLGQLIHDRHRLERAAPLQHPLLEQLTLFGR